MISIILPTYNEVKNIPRLVRKIHTVINNCEIIIVDDNSPDGTGKIAQELANKGKVKVIHRKKRLGLSTAVVAGFRKAQGDIIGVMDADLSHPPEVIPKLVDVILKKKADFVIGSRLVKGGGVTKWPLRRKLISMTATSMARMLTNIRDPLSGFFFVKRETVNKIKFTSKGYKICLEILVRGRYKSIKEIPYIFNVRRAGASKLNIFEYYKFIIDWIRLMISNGN